MLYIPFAVFPLPRFALVLPAMVASCRLVARGALATAVE
jgi:hypothetical protein